MSTIAELQKLAGLQPGSKTLPESPDQMAIARSVVGHKDFEKKGARKDLMLAAKDALDLVKLIDQLPDDSDFPYWWTGKLREATKNLTDLHRYIQSEMTTTGHSEKADKITERVSMMSVYLYDGVTGKIHHVSNMETGAFAVIYNRLREWGLFFRWSLEWKSPTPPISTDDIYATIIKMKCAIIYIHEGETTIEINAESDRLYDSALDATMSELISPSSMVTVRKVIPRVDGTNVVGKDISVETH